MKIVLVWFGWCVCAVFIGMIDGMIFWQVWKGGAK